MKLELVVDDWIGPRAPESDASLAAFRISAQKDSRCMSITEVDDTIARTVRNHIYVPIEPVVRWFLTNWWRLRCERERPKSLDWHQAHSMASIGMGYAWPPLVIDSDGQFIQVRIQSETSSDVSAIRYLCSASLSLPTESFDIAVDRLVMQLFERLRVFGGVAGDLHDLRQELDEERSDAELARKCQLQAIAGFDPGAAPDEWLDEVLEIQRGVGLESVEEAVAALEEPSENLQGIRADIQDIRKSPSSIDLSWVLRDDEVVDEEIPWVRGSRLASRLRNELGWGTSPVQDSELGKRLDVHLPFRSSSGKRLVAGGMRHAGGNGRTSIVVPSQRADSQRFYLARLIGCAVMYGDSEQLLPVTQADTALQKAGRSFAQELLCPWSALDEFTDQNGLDEDAIADAAQHFQVSDWLVRWTLINRGKLPHDRQPR